METLKLAFTIVSLLLNTGLFALMYRLNIQWYTVRERNDILWLEYCQKHNIPFRPVNKDFEAR